MNTHYPFALQPLPYSFHALQPFLNRETVCNHYESTITAITSID